MVCRVGGRAARWKETMMNANPISSVPWNKGKLIGQKLPLKPKDIWAMRVRLEMEHRVRELALFNLGTV